jgi:hypothetical protein
VTIVRKGHAFDGQNLAAIGSRSRCGVLFVLVSLPDGSRSFVPAKRTDWEGNGFEGSVSFDHDTATNHLARLYDLIHLRKVLDAVQSRLDQRALSVERHDATETCAFQSSQSAARDLRPDRTSTAWDDIDETSRLTALAILARLIAQMLAAGHEKGARDD